MTLEFFQETDAAGRLALVDLWVEAWSAAMLGLDFEARRSWFVEHLDRLLGEGAGLVVTRAENGRIEGFITVHRETGEIDQLVVQRDAQGRGLARALLDEAKRLSPRGLHLAVNTANERAVALYARAGFFRTGESRNPRSGLPVWTMRWVPPAR